VYFALPLVLLYHSRLFCDTISTFDILFLPEVKGCDPDVRVANSKPELSQLLFISVRQRELVKSSRWIWSIYLYRFYLVCVLVSHTTM